MPGRPVRSTEVEAPIKEVQGLGLLLVTARYAGRRWSPASRLLDVKVCGDRGVGGVRPDTRIAPAPLLAEVPIDLLTDPVQPPPGQPGDGLDLMRPDAHDAGRLAEVGGDDRVLSVADPRGLAGDDAFARP